MTVAQTSLDAWVELTKSNRVNANQMIVLDVFTKQVKGQPLSNYDLSVMLDWPINRITPRVHELVRMGRLVCVGIKRQLQTGRRVQLWGLPEDNMPWVDFDYLETKED